MSCETFVRAFVLLAALLAPAAVPAGAAAPVPREGDFVLPGFQFRSGERLDSLRIHYLTLGRLARDARGQATNAVLILHGTGGSGRQFLAPQFADVLFRPGGALDTTRFFVILPDGIGHGHSSKPSDQLRAHFPRYDYDDMVDAQYRLVSDGLGVGHLRLVMGTSMGGMHTWMWGEAHPEFMDALMPLACLPVRIAGRNRMWREMLMRAIRDDPEWRNGEYTSEPHAALRTALDLLLIAGSAPLLMQKSYPTPEAADAYVAEAYAKRLDGLDANDLLYQVGASRDYDPSPGLDQIQAPVLFVNSADDFINPPELGIAEREIRRVRRGRFRLIPASEQTHGHGTHTWAALWHEDLDGLLAGTAQGARIPRK